ncbi:MAG: hypothetical protein RI954_368 [Actinomycetota bacterium]|jgi:hypothetical protein
MNFPHLEHHVVGEAMQLSRPIAEAASWRLAAELIRRHPDELYAIETHPMTGQYDCLSIYRHTGANRHDAVFQLNRMPGGHVTPKSWFSTQGERFNWLDVMLSVDLRREIVVPLEHMEGLVPPRETPQTTRTSIGARVIATALWSRLQSSPMYALNGVLDSSGAFGSGIQTGLFASFSGMSSQLDGHDPKELDGHPAYHYWFVIGHRKGANDQPILGIDTWRGLVWTNRLAGADLMDLYDQCDREINLLVARLLLV